MRQILVSALLAALLASAVTYTLVVRNPATPAIAHESAYERVMRTGTLRCGYMPWPLWTDRDPNTGAMSGIVVEVTNALAAKLGFKVEWTEEVLVGQQVETLKRGTIDAICTADGPYIYTQAAQVNYTRPFAYGFVRAYGRSSETRFRSMADLNHESVTISAIDGDVSSTLAVEHLPQAKLLSLPQTADASLLMLNVIGSKADALLIDPSAVKAMETSHPGALKPLFPEPIAIFGLSFTTAKGEYDLTRMLDQGFDLLQNLGITDRILDHYDPQHTDILRVASNSKP